MLARGMRVVRVRASRRRTHNSVSADSPSKAFSGIAAIWLFWSCLRARDEAPRQSSEAPCDVSQAAWRGVDARERAGHNRACVNASRRAASSLARCCAAASPSVRARERACAPMRWSVGTRRRLAGSTDEPMHTCSSSSTEARDACAHVIGVRRRMHKNRKRAGCSRVVRVRASRRRTHKLVSADSPAKAF